MPETQRRRLAIDALTAQRLAVNEALSFAVAGCSTGTGIRQKASGGLGATSTVGTRWLMIFDDTALFRIVVRCGIGGIPQTSGV